MRIRHVAMLACLAVAAAPWARDAAAQPGPRSAEVRTAEALKQRGNAAFDALRYPEALELYTQAYEVAHDPALLYNRGRALEAMSRFPEALVEIERFRAAAPAELRARVPKLDELIAELRERVTTVRVACNVRGARVVVGDKIVGSTPFEKPVRVNAGNAVVVEVSAEGYTTFARKYDLPRGGELAIDAHLAVRDRSGALLVRSPVPGASVFVDGALVGNPPAEIVVDAGEHEVLVRAEGYRDAITSAVVRAGERRDLEVALDAGQPLTKKWWFWAGVGAVVVGGVATWVALTTERKPDSGDFTPGQASAPLVRW